MFTSNVRGRICSLWTNFYVIALKMVTTLVVTIYIHGETNVS